MLGLVVFLDADIFKLIFSESRNESRKIYYDNLASFDRNIEQDHSFVHWIEFQSMVYIETVSFLNCYGKVLKKGEIKVSNFQIQSSRDFNFLKIYELLYILLLLRSEAS